MGFRNATSKGWKVPACMRHHRAESVAFLPLRGELPIAPLGSTARKGDDRPAIQTLVGLVERARDRTAGHPGEP